MTTERFLILFDRWHFLLIGLLLVLLAALVNRFVPQSRKYVRQSSILYGLYVVAFLLELAAGALDLTAWVPRAHFVTTLLQSYTLVSLGGLTLFNLLLPAVRVNPVSITSDIAIGVAYVVTTIAVLRAAGMDLGSVVTTSAIVSGILALSLQATLGNILGGVALQLDGSVDVGQWLQLPDGTQGKVKEIRWRHTVLETRDWGTLIVPNAFLLSSNILILGKREGLPSQHRMWVMFNVDFRFSPQRVIDVVNDALNAAPIERVAAEPKPHAICLEFGTRTPGESSVAKYAARYWLTDLAADDPTNSVVRTRVYAALKRAGIPLARPAQTVFHIPDDETQDDKRRARHRGKRLRALQSVELFQELTEDELTLLAERLRFAPFAQGETVTKQGAVAHFLYILAEGKVEIRTKVAGASRVVATVEAPGFVGEMGLMTGEPRFADVVAVTDVECFRLEKTAFEKVLLQRPDMATQISSTLATRRVALEAARDGLDAEAQRQREAAERERILAKIQEFFGLSS